MSALGQKRTLKRLHPMSALPPKADIAERDHHVRFWPPLTHGAAFTSWRCPDAAALTPSGRARAVQKFSTAATMAALMSERRSGVPNTRNLSMHVPRADPYSLTHTSHNFPETLRVMLVRLAERLSRRACSFECSSPSFAGVPMKPFNRPRQTKRRQLIPAHKCIILRERCA